MTYIIDVNIWWFAIFALGCIMFIFAVIIGYERKFQPFRVSQVQVVNEDKTYENASLQNPDFNSKKLEISSRGVAIFEIANINEFRQLIIKFVETKECVNITLGHKFAYDGKNLNEIIEIRNIVPVKR